MTRSGGRSRGAAVWQTASSWLVAKGALINRAASKDGLPFDTPELIRPHLGSRRYGATHNGMMIPNLPEPFGMLSITTFAGQPGMLMTDANDALVDTPRDTANVQISTGAPGTAAFRALSIPRDCDLAPDGSHWRYGDCLTIDGTYPELSVQAATSGLEVDLRLHMTDKVTWFVKTPIYDHISVLCDFDGALGYQGENIPVDGRCTYEYFRISSLYQASGRNRPFADEFRLPADYFTYQVINIDDDTQLLLAQVQMRGHVLAKGAFVRGTNEYNRTYPDVTFTVTEAESRPRIDPSGIRMLLPERFRWTVRDGGNVIAELDCTVCSEFNYGLGVGYVGGYRYTGTFRGRQVTGPGYVEYIDRQQHA